MSTTPEQTLTDLEADLALLAPDIRRMFTRANDALNGPRAAGGTASGGFDANDPRYDTPPTPDEAVPLGRDEARAINGPDIAERDIHQALKELAGMHRSLRRIRTLLAPYQLRHRPFDPNDVPDGWCPNCYRLCDRQHSPTKTRKRKDGTEGPEWTDGWCSFCGRFQAAHGWLPTRKILQRHHGPGKVTEQLIDAEERALPRDVKAKLKADRAATPPDRGEFTRAS